MPRNDNPKSSQVPDAQGKSDKPPRRKPLDTLERVRREITSVYFEEREGRIDMERAKGRAYLLGCVSAVLKAEFSGDEELALLRKRAREKLKEKP